MPVIGGSSIQLITNTIWGATFGTLGAWVQYQGAPHLISNNHVLPEAGKGVAHPLRQGGRRIATVIARNFNQGDWALASEDGNGDSSKDVGNIVYNAFADPVNGLQVSMWGAVSGAGTGSVDTNTTYVKLGLNCVRLVPNANWGVHGDSGSVIIDTATRDIVGLYWGSNGNNQFIHPFATLANQVGFQSL